MLTAVKAHRALQNPALFTSDHYRQAGIAVLSGLAIRLVISIPVSTVPGSSPRSVRPALFAAHSLDIITRSLA